MCRLRSGPDADDAIARQAVDPAGAIGANEPGVEPPAIGHPLQRSRLTCGETEGRLRQGDSQREGTARDLLTIGAVARVDQLGRLGDLIADFAELAEASVPRSESVVLTQRLPVLQSDMSSARANAVSPRRDSLTALVPAAACVTQPNSRNRCSRAAPKGPAIWCRLSVQSRQRRATP